MENERLLGNFDPETSGNDELDNALSFAFEEEHPNPASDPLQDDTQERDDAISSLNKRRRLERPALVPRAPDTGQAKSRLQPHLAGLLGKLPPELLFKTLSLLSADDLTSAACVCRLFRQAACSSNLWRRLFIARWGSVWDDVDNVREWERPPTWKERYMERDAMEMQEVCSSVSGIMRPFYAQMTAAKRSMALGLEHSEKLPLFDPEAAGQLAAWRRSRGLPIAPSLHHTCQARCSYSKLGNNVFVCERCGWAHLCGDACTERFMDLNSELPVCPISGRCFSRMMTPWEEAREADMRGKGDEGATDHMEDFSMAGRLARAYVDGYNCVSEEELRQICGVALR